MNWLIFSREPVGMGLPLLMTMDLRQAIDEYFQSEGGHPPISRIDQYVSMMVNSRAV